MRAAVAAGCLLFAPPSWARPDTALAIVLPDGRCEMRQASAQALAGFTGRLEEARQEAAGLAGRLAAEAAVAHFAEAREAVPAFGAWAYDWVQSYVTAYRIAGRMVTGLVATVRGDAASPLEGMIEQMAAPVRQAFAEQVLARAAPEDALQRDLAMVGGLVEAGWRAALLDAVAPLRAGPEAVEAAVRIDLAAASRNGVWLSPGDEAEGGATPGGGAASLFLHSMRPVAARVSALALRATEAGSAIAAVGALGYQLAGAPGLAVGAVGGVGIYWGVDWVLNRADAALNQEDFEAQALDVIARAEAGIAEEARRQVLEALDSRAARLSGRGGCPAAVPGAGVP